MSWSNVNGPQPGPSALDDVFAGTPGDDSPPAGGDGNDTLLGEDGADTLSGGEGDDSILGGAGDDWIISGAGLDTLDGGSGTNALDFTDATTGVSMVLAQGDLFNDGFGNDESVAGFTVAYGSQHDDGLFAGSQQGDSLFGNDGDDGVFGNDGNDTLEGGNGNDLVSGESGIDLVSGNDGDDTLHGGQYLFEDPIFGAPDADAATLDGGTGFDVAIVNRGFSGSHIGFTAGPSVVIDNVVVTDVEAFAVRTGAGSDTLVGGAGNDSFDGGTGSDSLEGGDGHDLLVIERGDATGDLGFTAGASVSLDGTTATGFEVFKVRTGSGSDTLIGGDGNDTLDGGLGRDHFEGGGGDDLINGGDVVLLGEEGNIIDVLRDSDLVTYENGADAISFSLTEGSGLVVTGTAGIDELVNIERLVGSAHDDSMEMSWGAQTVDILMEGRDGHDWINLVGEAAATLDGGAGNDSIAGGFGSDTILGGEGDDWILGGDGDDSIVATPGRDTVEGNVGNDSIETGDDADLVTWRLGDGDDTIDLGAGDDTLSLEGWNPEDTASGAWSLSIDGTTATFAGDGSVGNAVITVLNYEETDTVVCFVEGTRILTPSGEVPVETLRAGDAVVVAGRGAPVRPVRWVGHRHVEITRPGAQAALAPVLLRAGALGPGMPHRDLRVSPEHALLLDGQLVPARLLVNGTTIMQETWRRSLTYWHVELDRHGLLVAEGALAESYLDTGNRTFFDHPAVMALNPSAMFERDQAADGMRACAPVLAEGDAALNRIRLRLAGYQQPVERRRA